MSAKTVTSSFITAVAYDKTTLTVRFRNGKMFQYPKVPRETAVAFIRAKSKGRYYNAHIRGVYEGEAVE